jgi:hypothetical protein
MDMLSIIEAAQTIIDAAIGASSTSLGTVLKTYKGSFPPQAISPSICIGADTEAREHKRAAGTAPIAFGEQYRWFILIIVTTGNLETSFENACGIWKELKPIVDQNYLWDDTVDDTNYNGDIAYGEGEVIGDRSGLTYNILVPLVSNIRWGETR